MRADLSSRAASINLHPLWVVCDRAPDPIAIRALDIVEQASADDAALVGYGTPETLGELARRVFGSEADTGTQRAACFKSLLKRGRVENRLRRLRCRFGCI